ncbi:MAG TPA: hypothetical protein DIT03_14530, partial [Candidatus Accumulibacter sp.]|nr:hypothetical protein [Accumulibacter sp.]
ESPAAVAEKTPVGAAGAAPGDEAAPPTRTAGTATPQNVGPGERKVAKPADQTAEKAEEKKTARPVEKPPEKSADKKAPKPAEKAPEKPPTRAAEKPAEKAPAKTAEKSTEKAAEKKPEKAAADRSSDKAPPKKVDKPVETGSEDGASKPATDEPAAAGNHSSKPPAPPVAKPGGQQVIVIGAFANPDNVRQLQSRISAAGVSTYTEILETPDGKKTRVRAGPFPNREAAEKALDKLKAIGVSGVVAGRQ